jgi:polyisoprenoid-binding protein YceI
MASYSISPASLKEQLSSDKPPVLIHLLSDEAFAEKRIPGSKHACVYEVAFLDKVAEIVDSKETPLVIYGVSDEFGASSLGLACLTDAAYRNVAKLTGGLSAWEAADYPLEGNGEGSSQVKDGTYPIDPEKSVFRWTGRNLFNQHNGRIAFQSGRLQMEGGLLSGGSVVLDMTRISCSDIKDEKMNSYLIRHLESSDFFSVSEFPIAQFSMTEMEPLDVVGPGENNLSIKGALTLRGQRQWIEFQGQQSFLGKQLGLQGRFEVDRTKFGSVYGSGKIFERLGQHVVNNKILVSFQLICPVT